MVSDIIIGNICSLCAMVTDSVSGARPYEETFALDSRFTRR